LLVVIFIEAAPLIERAKIGCHTDSDRSGASDLRVLGRDSEGEDRGKDAGGTSSNLGSSTASDTDSISRGVGGVGATGAFEIGSPFALCFICFLAPIHPVIVIG
jgi:hypothetical protein